MDSAFATSTTESLNGEAVVRPYHAPLSIHDKLRQELTRTDYVMAEALAQSFRIPDSGIGMVAFAETIGRDLSSLKAILPQFAIPAWSEGIGTIIKPLCKVLGTDASRDSIALRNLPRQPLRDYLTPCGQGMPVPQIRLLHAIRGLLTLLILASKGVLASDLAREFSKWLGGKFPEGLQPALLTPKGLAQWAAGNALGIDTVKLINQIANALQSELLSPFDAPICNPAWIGTSGLYNNLHDQDDQEDGQDADETAAKFDILTDRLAEQAIATRRMFAGVVTSRQLHPFELESVFPRILALADSHQNDASFAAETVFHFGVVPSQFHLIVIRPGEMEGCAIRFAGVGICLDLNRIIGHSADDETAGMRTVTIPYPAEFAQRLQARLTKYPNASTYDQLFSISMADLQRSTWAMLRSISISTHRVTLTRLARSRGRHALHLCRDEVYSALIGLDFLLGTTANFNYLTVRANRLKSVLRECYQSIGYSGDLAIDDIQDVMSPYLPSVPQVTALLTRLTTETATRIASLPKHCTVDKLVAAHNLISRNIYALTKFLSESRPVETETLTRMQLDLDGALASMTDKRVSRYHELRAVSLPAYLVTWLSTYSGWLRLVAYRLCGIKPKLAALIYSATAETSEDWHPLFFFLTDGLESVPIGSKVLANALAVNGIASNGGRHWVDAVAREAGIDSAAIMGQAGRGNAGQELFGRWSSATPAVALRSVSQAVDRWLVQLDLPAAPAINPRAFLGPAVPGDSLPYVPNLLETNTRWMEHALPRGSGAPEPCPFSRLTVAHAASLPGIFRHWRSSAPPSGWLGVALSLILEDGVVNEGELLGALAEIAGGSIYESAERVFVDSNTRSLGIRRTDLSFVTLQLARRVSFDECIPTTLADLDVTLPRWNSGSDADISIRDLLAKAEAHMALHIPAAVSAWARGMTFARTTRPATVAREIYSCIEPPTFDLRRRACRSIAPISVIAALELAKAKRQEGASHQTALLTLCEALDELLFKGCDTLHARIEVGHLRALAKSVKNLNTLLRYESGARNFVRRAADAIERSGSDDIDWKQITKDALLDRKDGSAPDIVAINSVLGWLGIDLHIYQRSAAPPSASSYADIVSSREVSEATRLLDRQQCWPGDDFHLASIVLRLLAQHPLRWDSVAHLRLCDLPLDHASPHLSISEEAGADLKSDNASRVIRLIDPDLVCDFQKLVELRRARFPTDEHVPVFGDVNDPRTIETAARVHRLVTDALWRATGSPVICVHDLRHRAITDRIHTLLAPDAHLKFDTLALRQGLVVCAVEAGQSWPQVSMENYGHNMERLRTQHYRGLLVRLTPPSDTFAATLIGIPAATLRKRRSRDLHYEPNVAEGFTWDGFRQGTTIVPLASLVAESQDHVPFTSEDQLRQTHTPRAIYVGLRLLGDTPEIARALSGFTIAQGKRFELALTTAPQRLGVSLQARDDINRLTFLKAVLGTELAVAMAAVHPDRSSIARIERSLHRAGEEWTFANARDALDLAPWVRIWAANDIATEFLMRSSSRSVVDGELLGQARCEGFARARTLPARHFGRGVSAMLRFYPRPDSATGSTRIRASPQTTFLVGACALAILIDPPGEDDVQEVQSS